MAEQRTRAASTSADEKDEKPQTPREATREAVAEVRADAPEDEPTYPRDHLIAESEAWGLGPSYVVAGAFAALGSPKKNFTINEVKAATEAFLSTVAPTEVS